MKFLLVYLMKERWMKNNEKLRIYLDTSVISHLDQQDAPEILTEGATNDTD